VEPEQVDCAEVDDHTAAGELAAYEALQFAPAGQGPELVDSGFTDLGGVLPVNTSGGLLSQGDATGASAVAQLCELSWQLREEAGSRQVAGARTALALSAYETAANRLAFVSLVILHV
jgi:acetyl-CoA acetyltransferase